MQIEVCEWQLSLPWLAVRGWDKRDEVRALLRCTSLGVKLVLVQDADPAVEVVCELKVLLGGKSMHLGRLVSQSSVEIARI